MKYIFKHGINYENTWLSQGPVDFTVSAGKIS